METLSIESHIPFLMKSIEETVARHWRIEHSPGETIAVHGNNARAYLYLESAAAAEKYRLLLDYSDVELAKNLLEQIANSSFVTVDNDFGTIMPGNQFVALCREKKGWDWRTNV